MGILSLLLQSRASACRCSSRGNDWLALAIVWSIPLSAELYLSRLPNYRRGNKPPNLQQQNLQPSQSIAQHPTFQASPAYGAGGGYMTSPVPPPPNPRKRRLSASSPQAPGIPGMGEMVGPPEDPALPPPSPVVKKGRTNTPWTPAEEGRLKTMREAGNSWSEIAKVGGLPTFLHPHIGLVAE